MSEVVLGFVGVLLGAAAAFSGTLYTTSAERRRRREDGDRRVQVAARAWREDFYAIQSVLAGRHRDGKWAMEFPAPLATDDHLLVLAERFHGYGQWTQVTATRRRIVRARQSYRTMSDAEIAELFEDINEGRRALSAVDTDWPYSPHPDSDVVAPKLPPDKILEDPPGTYGDN